MSTETQTATANPSTETRIVDDLKVSAFVKNRLREYEKDVLGRPLELDDLTSKPGVPALTDVAGFFNHTGDELKAALKRQHDVDLHPEHFSEKPHGHRSKEAQACTDECTEASAA